MRSTLTIDDALFRQLRTLAHQTDRSLKDVVNGALRAGLEQMTRRPPPRRYRYRMRTFSMGTPSVNLDKALQLADSLEDDEIVRKIELRK